MEKSIKYSNIKLNHDYNDYLANDTKIDASIRIFYLI